MASFSEDEASNSHFQEHRGHPTSPHYADEAESHQRARPNTSTYRPQMESWSEDEVPEIRTRTQREGKAPILDDTVDQEDAPSFPLSITELFNPQHQDNTHSVSPPLSPIPYEHPPVLLREKDIEWNSDDEGITEKMLNDARKKAGRLACVGITSSLSDKYLKWAVEYYDIEGIWARPLSGMRCHIFNYGKNFKIPRMVTSTRLIALGVCAPLHLYFQKIIEWFDLAPLQLSPNSYKLAIALYMLYASFDLGEPTMQELSYFFSLRRSGNGYFYLVVHSKHNSKGFSEGKVSNDKTWKDTFFYLYDVARVKTQFNPSPYDRDIKDIRELDGDAQDRVATILALPQEYFDLKVLITETRLKETGFLSERVGTKVSFMKFRAGEPIVPKGDKEEITTPPHDQGAPLDQDFDIVDDDMSGIPKGFGTTKSSDKTKPSRTVGTRLIKKDDKNKPFAAVEKTPVKRKVNPTVVEDLTDTGGAPFKKPQTATTTSLINIELQSLEYFIKDDEVQSWKDKDIEEENQMIIKASAQILIQSLGRVASFQKDKARLRQLEADRTRLTRTVKTLEGRIKSIKEEKEENESNLQKEVDSQKEMVQNLNTCIENLNAEISTLRARIDDLTEDQQNGWADEKKLVEEEHFAKGFRFYATGFLANDPDYDFTKFGEETVQWIADFKIKEAEAIRARRIELGLEEASLEDNATVEAEGATLDHEKELEHEVPPETTPPADAVGQSTQVNATNLEDATQGAPFNFFL